MKISFSVPVLFKISLTGLTLSLVGCDRTPESVQQVREHEAAQRAGKTRSGYYEGILGGVPVRIPKSQALFFSYNKPKSIFEKKSNEIEGFAIKTSMNELMGDYYRGKGIEEKFLNDEVRILVYAGESYGVGQKALEAKVNYCEEKLKDGRRKFIIAYNETLGMQECIRDAPISASNFHWYGETDKYYYSRDADGKASTFISCRSAPYETVSCSQWFVLEPEMKVHLHVDYNRYFLKDWAAIQERITMLFLGFRTIH